MAEQCWIIFTAALQVSLMSDWTPLAWSHNIKRCGNGLFPELKVRRVFFYSASCSSSLWRAYVVKKCRVSARIRSPGRQFRLISSGFCRTAGEMLTCALAIDTGGDERRRNIQRRGRRDFWPDDTFGKDQCVHQWPARFTEWMVATEISLTGDKRLSSYICIQSERHLPWTSLIWVS